MKNYLEWIQEIVYNDTILFHLLTETSVWYYAKSNQQFVLKYNSSFYLNNGEKLLFLMSCIYYFLYFVLIRASQIFWALKIKWSLRKILIILKIRIGKWSELRISERRKPKRTPKTMQTITTSKRFIKVIGTSKSERRKCLLSWSELRRSERRK